MRKEALLAFKKCCQAVSPYNCTKNALSISGDVLSILSSRHSISLMLSPVTRIALVGFGKAVIPMVQAVEEIVGPDRFLSGIAIAPNALEAECPRLMSTVYRGAANNMPDKHSVAATKQVLDMIEKNDSENTIFLFLISGGGSALFCSPDGFSLSEKLAAIKVLTSHGANIRQLNIMRQRLSLVKGGKTLQHIRKGKVVSLIISDLIDDRVDLIASGPTSIPSPSTFSNHEFTKLPPLESILDKRIIEKLKEPLTYPYSVPEHYNVIIASNKYALNALQEHFSKMDYSSHIVTASLEGDATGRGLDFANLISSFTNLEKFMDAIHFFNGKFELTRIPKKLALIFGGETTVTIKGPGRGGRNQEMVLACLTKLSEENCCSTKFLFMSAGTDGQDGPTDAAGAFICDHNVSTNVVREASSYLNSSNSYEFWTKFNNGNNHIKTGPTGTNVMDIQVVLLEVPEYK